ncbi:TPA: Rpn family recombination-promoting nuclease/putative transposase [Candidatus Poribacteria bacterium]|nr:Rpn family recombination-promoting nuclease/putative transposase [Candidatus Poribacteria bacterium]
MSRFICPITDFGFKKLFGEEESKEVLKSFLFHILNLESEIADISFLPQEQLPSAEDERLGIYDLYCIDEKGRRFIVEMQRASQMYFKDRSIYYSTFLIAQQAQRGDWDYQLNAVYCVGILNFNLTEDGRYIRTCKICDIETHEIFYDKLTFVYIELPKFNKGLNELVSLADKWIYFLKHLSELEEIPQELSDEPISAAFKMAEIAAYNEAERFAYQRSLKRLRDSYGQIEYARITGREQGALAALRGTLLLLLREKFGQIPQAIERQIESIQDKEKLNLLLTQVVSADSISELDFEI